jgi:hypothetical protein
MSDVTQPSLSAGGLNDVGVEQGDDARQRSLQQRRQLMSHAQMCAANHCLLYVLTTTCILFLILFTAICMAAM